MAWLAALFGLTAALYASVGFGGGSTYTALLTLVKRYVNVPMSLADACLVRLAELYPQSSVLTMDGDFSVYRKNGRQVISVLGPE